MKQQPAPAPFQQQTQQQAQQAQQQAQQAQSATPIKRIAEALAMEVTRTTSVFGQYRFRNEESAFVVSYTRVPHEDVPESEKSLYVVLGPAGEQCECCKGSGKRGT